MRRIACSYVKLENCTLCVLFKDIHSSIDRGVWVVFVSDIRSKVGEPIVEGCLGR